MFKWLKKEPAKTPLQPTPWRPVSGDHQEVADARKAELVELLQVQLESWPGFKEATFDGRKFQAVIDEPAGGLVVTINVRVRPVDMAQVKAQEDRRKALADGLRAKAEAIENPEPVTGVLNINIDPAKLVKLAQERKS